MISLQYARLRFMITYFRTTLFIFYDWHRFREREQESRTSRNAETSAIFPSLTVNFEHIPERTIIGYLEKMPLT